MLSLFLLIEFLFFITILNYKILKKYSMFSKNDLIYFGSILLLSGKGYITDSHVDEAIEAASIVFNKVFTDEN